MQGTSSSGRPTFDIRASVAFTDREGRRSRGAELSLRSTAHGDGGGFRYTVLMPAIKVPADAREVHVWFYGRALVNDAWDSYFGKNYNFPVI